MLQVRSLLFGSAFVIVACGGGSDVLIGEQSADGRGGSDASVGGGQDGGANEGASGGTEGGKVDSGAGMDSGAEAAASDGPANDNGTPESGGGNDGSVIDPASVPGLVLWLDARTGVTQVAGAVSAWADQTSNHNDASQSVATEQPTLNLTVLNGWPALHFNKDHGGSSTATGAGDEIDIADSPSLQWGVGDFYVVVVASFDNTLADGDERGVGMLFSKTASGGNVAGPLLTANIIGGISTTNQTGLAFSTSLSTGDWVSTNAPYNNGAPHAFAMQRVGSKLDLRVDGTSIGTSVSDDNDVSAVGTPVSIGSGTTGRILRLDGDIAEILAVKGILAASDRTGLEGYVRTRYGL